MKGPAGVMSGPLVTGIEHRTTDRDASECHSANQERDARLEQRRH